ncbi:hypothetical protein H8B13_14610 [Hymenobacter sp. BT188]|uniref:hypothetical protein n=1 Tax=Hymenobacter sp. BT188 TaxID=2763504 RepID=UPI0016516B8C|nr:hypothetical protein [Hymenobacter sp. BT188]MBC6608056.1 hypothetical protein [Hymenobacter sp. BT188]
MSTRLITLCYRKIIDANASRPWEKMVFEDTYTEFRMQAQLLNQEKKYRSFGELLHYAPGADQLHFLVSAAVRGYVQQLGGLVPDVIDNLGRHFLKFSKFQFEIINSDLLDKARHQVAINFYSEPLMWHDTIGTQLLVSEAAGVGGEILTNQLSLLPFLSIYSLQTRD